MITGDKLTKWEEEGPVPAQTHPPKEEEIIWGQSLQTLQVEHSSQLKN